MRRDHALAGLRASVCCKQSRTRMLSMGGGKGSNTAKSRRNPSVRRRLPCWPWLDTLLHKTQLTQDFVESSSVYCRPRSTHARNQQSSKSSQPCRMVIISCWVHDNFSGPVRNSFSVFCDFDSARNNILMNCLSEPMAEYLNASSRATGHRNHKL